MDDAQITVAEVLNGCELLLIKNVLRNTISVRAEEREEAALLLIQCQQHDIDRLSMKLGAVILLSDDISVKLLSAMRLQDYLTGDNWRAFYQLTLHTQRGFEEVLFASVKYEHENVVFLHVCTLVARIASIKVHNGWRNSWPSKVMQFICENLLARNTPVTLCKRVLKLFGEWSRLVTVLDLSVDCKLISKFEATIVSHLKDWKSELCLAAFDAVVGYLPHLRRTGEEKVFSVMVAAIVGFLNGALEDGREELIQDGLDLLVDLANTRPDLLMDDGLHECLMEIAGKDDVEDETVSKATEFVLVLGERGELSMNDMGVRFGELIAVFVRQLTKVVEGDGVDEQGKSESYDIGKSGLVRVAGIWGEEEMMAQAEIYNVQYGSGTWEQRRAVIATYDAIIEGCTSEKVMTLMGLKRALGIGLVFLKDKEPKVKLAALHLIMTIFDNSLQLYAHSKVEVHRLIHEMLVESKDQAQVQEVAREVLNMYNTVGGIERD